MRQTKNNMNEPRFLFISGYWKDNKVEFEDYQVKTSDGRDENDDNVFFYGMNEDVIKDAIKQKENTIHEFVITSYHK